MNLKELIEGLASYAKDVAAPQIPDTGQRAIFYWQARVAELQAECIAKEYGPRLRLIGLVDSEGVVNLDVLEQAGFDTFQAIPQATHKGYTFRREDFADFMNHIKGIVKD